MPRLLTARPVPRRSVVRKVEGYHPICLFARGGMAQVFLARSLSRPFRLVAIKTLRVSYIGDMRKVAMFADEMRIAHLLRHPNVVELVTAGVIEGEPFLVLEFIDGPSLRELCELHEERLDRPMEPALAVTLALGACRGLQYAHEQVDEWGTPLELVHRDINPQNLMVTRGGVLKVVDFGVAKAVGQTHETVGRGVKGKMAYAAPEYIKGQIPDQRADVFALGVVLWELLTNQSLFDRGTTVLTMQAVAYDEPQPPSVHNPEIPPDLDRLVLASLSKDPEGRLGSAEAFGLGLEACSGALGGLLTLDQVSGLLATRYSELLDDRSELDPEMSDDELLRGAGHRSSEGSALWESVEIDVSEFDRYRGE